MSFKWNMKKCWFSIVQSSVDPIKDGFFFLQLWVVLMNRKSKCKSIFLKQSSRKRLVDFFLAFHRKNHENTKLTAENWVFQIISLILLNSFDLRVHHHRHHRANHRHHFRQLSYEWLVDSSDDITLVDRVFGISINKIWRDLNCA